MKLTALLLCTATFAHAAQQPARLQNQPEVVVLAFSWRTYVNRPNWDRDQYRTPAQADADERDRVQRQRQPRGPILRPGELPTAPEYRREQSLSGTKGFQYRAIVENTGRKTIWILSWDYVFLDSSGKEVGRHSFNSHQRIKPGGRAELKEFSVSAPGKVVSASDLSRDIRYPYAERVIITRVEYTDGSVWMPPRR